MSGALHVTAGPEAKTHPGVSLGRFILDRLKTHAALSIPAQVRGKMAK